MDAELLIRQLDNQAKITEKYNRRMYHVTMACIIAMIAFSLSFVCIVQCMSDDFSETIESMSDDYWYSDYDYGVYEDNKTQEVEVNVN